MQCSELIFCIFSKVLQFVPDGLADSEKYLANVLVALINCQFDCFSRKSSLSIYITNLFFKQTPQF